MGEGNVFSLFTLGGGSGGVRSSRGGGGQVQLAGGGQVQPGGASGPAGGGGQLQPGGVMILRPLAGGMPLAFTQEDFLVCPDNNT